MHRRIHRGLVTACIIFPSCTFIFSGNFISNLHGMVGRCTGCYILERRGAAIALPATKKYSFQRSVFLIWECPDERVSLASGNYDIAERSELLTRAAQFLDYSSRIVYICRGNLQISKLIVQLLHLRLTVTPVLCSQCHHSPTAIANLPCSYRSVSLYNLRCNTRVCFSAICRSENHYRKKIPVFLLKLATEWHPPLMLQPRSLRPT